MRTANKFAIGALGLKEVPPLQAKTVGMMGLKGVTGLNVVRGCPSKEMAGGGAGSKLSPGRSTARPAPKRK